MEKRDDKEEREGNWSRFPSDNYKKGREIIYHSYMKKSKWEDAQGSEKSGGRGICRSSIF